jgi:hypothetical protein
VWKHRLLGGLGFLGRSERKLWKYRGAGKLVDTSRCSLLAFAWHSLKYLHDSRLWQFWEMISNQHHDETKTESYADHSTE